MVTKVKQINDYDKRRDELVEARSKASREYERASEREYEAKAALDEAEARRLTGEMDVEALERVRDRYATARAAREAAETALAAHDGALARLHEQRAEEKRAAALRALSGLEKEYRALCGEQARELETIYQRNKRMIDLYQEAHGLCPAEVASRWPVPFLQTNLAGIRPSAMADRSMLSRYYPDREGSAPGTALDFARMFKRFAEEEVK